MKRINLLPPEITAGRKARQEKALLGMVFGGVVFVLALVWLTLHLQLNQQRERLASAQAKAQTLQIKINSLARFAVLEESINSRINTLSGAMTNDIGWSRLLRDVSNVVPANSWLTAFSGVAQEDAGGSVPTSPAPPASAGGAPAAAPPAAGAPASGAPAAGGPATAAPGAAVPMSPGAAAAAGTLPPKLGTLSFTAVTFDFPGVARWITTLEQLGTLQNIFVPTATKSQVEGRDVVNFTSTADLSQAARSGRYQRRS